MPLHKPLPIRGRTLPNGRSGARSHRGRAPRRLSSGCRRDPSQPLTIRRRRTVRKILIAECMQEISSFNPISSTYENFHVERGEELYAQRGLNTSVGGALRVFERRVDHGRASLRRPRRQCRDSVRARVGATLERAAGGRRGEPARDRRHLRLAPWRHGRRRRTRSGRLPSQRDPPHGGTGRSPS